MKRSEINKAIHSLETLAAKHGFALPPFCGYDPQDWPALGPEYDEIRNNMLGWDVTDYGMGDFGSLGLTLITMRNGNVRDSASKTYAEKLMMSIAGQVSPMHFHFRKTEDIINRGGGALMMKLYNSCGDGSFGGSDVVVSRDGRRFVYRAGHVFTLLPGESVTLTPGLYHEFWAENERCLIGEVSQINDDNTDNRFYKPLARYSDVTEDEKPYRLLCNEYPAAV